MEIYDGHERFSSEINTDSSFKSGDFDISKDDFSFGYAREPGYKEELKLKELLDDNKSNNNEDGNDVNSTKQFSLLYSLVR